MSTDYDVIVVGSGMGGMTTAAALPRMEHKVLLLEQAQTIGGLTHFSSGTVSLATSRISMAPACLFSEVVGRLHSQGLD